MKLRIRSPLIICCVVLAVAALAVSMSLASAEYRTEATGFTGKIEMGTIKGDLTIQSVLGSGSWASVGSATWRIGKGDFTGGASLTLQLGNYSPFVGANTYTNSSSETVTLRITEVNKWVTSTGAIVSGYDTNSRITVQPILSVSGVPVTPNSSGCYELLPGETLTIDASCTRDGGSNVLNGLNNNDIFVVDFTLEIHQEAVASPEIMLDQLAADPLTPQIRTVVYTNHSSIPALLRVRVLSVWQDGSGSVLSLPESVASPDAGVTVTLTAPSAGAANPVAYKHTDGYYYFKDSGSAKDFLLSPGTDFQFAIEAVASDLALFDHQAFVGLDFTTVRLKVVLVLEAIAPGHVDYPQGVPYDDTFSWYHFPSP